jgi:hypothetical protein
MSGMFQGCFSLAVGTLSGTQISIGYAGCKLSEAGLVAIFTALGTVVGKTITVSGTPGDANLTAPDLLIATAKGWTVAQ